jgi:hypothetical protein
MWAAYHILLLSATALLSRAQNFVPTTADGNFPACGASCAVLQQAQSTCISQTGQNNALAAENCFCQSATLQGLYTTPDAVCVSECPQSQDRVNLRLWFTTFCSQVGSGINPASTSTTVATTTSTSTDAPTATDDQTSSSSSDSDGQSNNNNSNSNKSW